VPTVDDLGKAFKEKYKGSYDSYSDADIGRAVKSKYPGKYDNFEDSTFSQMSVKDRASKNLAAQTVISGLPQGSSGKQVADTLQKQGVEEQKASDKKAYGKLASTAVKTIGVGAASLATGGLAMGGAIALMGGAGLMTSLAGTAIEEGTGTHKSFGDRVTETAIDTGLATISEAGVQGIGYFAKTLLPQAAIRAATRGQYGEEVLRTIRQTKLNSIMEDIRVATPSRKAGEFMVDASKPLKKAYNEFDKVASQRGTGEFFGEQFGSFTPKAQEGIKAIEGHLKLARRGGQIGDLQPLDGVIRAKQSFQQYAHDVSLSDTEKQIFSDAAKGLNETIRQNLKVIGQKTLYSYDQLNAIGTAQFRAKASEELVRRFIYGAIGGGIGGHYGGAAGGLVLGAAGAAMPDISAFVLEHMAENPKAAILMRRAVDNLTGPGISSAMNLTKQAVEEAGMKGIIKTATKPPDAAK
jgi:hypothetical protein